MVNEDKQQTLLIEKARNGDMESFENLIKQSEKIVYNIAYRMMNHCEDVKDISQEVFIKVYKNLKNFDGKSSFSTWIYRIAVNTCIDEMRKRKGKQTVSIEEESQQEDGGIMKKQISAQTETPEEDYIKKEQQKELLLAVEELSPSHKTVLTLRDLEGFSYSEIAEITETSVGTVKSRLSRAREQLKNKLELLESRYRQNI